MSKRTFIPYTPKVHLRQAQNTFYERNGKRVRHNQTACRSNHDDATLLKTDDYSKVTCKRCLKVMRASGVMPEAVHYVPDESQPLMLFCGGDGTVRTAWRTADPTIVSCPDCLAKFRAQDRWSPPDKLECEAKESSPAFSFLSRIVDEGVTIPMLLHCPQCGERHIDEQKFEKVAHHTHACQSCGHVWRPAKVNTHGVRFLPGYKNEEPS